MPYPRKPSDQPSYKGINYEAFSSLCGPCNGDKTLINGSLVTSIGKKHGKSGAQVCHARLACHINLLTLPDSNLNPARVGEFTR